MSMLNTEMLDQGGSILRAADRRTALAVLLEPQESPEAGNARFAGLSPVSYALTIAEQENLPWVIMVQGNRLQRPPRLLSHWRTADARCGQHFLHRNSSNKSKALRKPDSSRSILPVKTWWDHNKSVHIATFLPLEIKHRSPR
jgi:hypothetical protein